MTDVPVRQTTEASQTSKQGRRTQSSLQISLFMDRIKDEAMA